MKTKSYMKLSCTALFISGLSFYDAAGSSRKLEPDLKRDKKAFSEYVEGSGEKARSESGKPGRSVKVKIHDGDTIIIRIDAPSSSSYRFNILTHRDSLVSSLVLNGGTTLLPALPDGHYHYEVLSDSGSVLARGRFNTPSRDRNDRSKAYKVDTKIIKGDTAKLWIEGSHTIGYSLHILTHKDSLVTSVNVFGGINNLPVLPDGHYHYKLIGDSGAVVARGKFDYPSKDKSNKPDVKIRQEELLEFLIGAPGTERFSLTILTHSDSVITTHSVTGGLNYLPVLLPGHYHYELAGDSGLVKKGKFNIRVPKVKSVIAPNPSAGDGSIWIDAPVTEQFELFIYSSADLVSRTAISGGSTLLPVLPSGLYSYKIADSNSNVISKGRISIEK